jgi:hypothetical protein
VAFVGLISDQLWCQEMMVDKAEMYADGIAMVKELHPAGMTVTSIGEDCKTFLQYVLVSGSW